MRKIKIKNFLPICFRVVSFLSFYIVLFIVIILKAFFNYFENISWWLIFSPILFSIAITILLFAFFITVDLIEKIIKRLKNV